MWTLVTCLRDWCPHCRDFKPFLEKARPRLQELHVNVRDMTEAEMEFCHITGIPALRLTNYSDGELKDARWEEIAAAHDADAIVASVSGIIGGRIAGGAARKAPRTLVRRRPRIHFIV